MAAAIAFAATPHVDIAQISAANTNRDGTGTIVSVAAGTANGKLIHRVRLVATGVTTAGMVRLYVSDGANIRLYAERNVAAATPSATVQAWSDEIILYDFVLPTGYSLQASTHNAETFNIIAFGAAV